MIFIGLVGDILFYFLGNGMNVSVLLGGGVTERRRQRSRGGSSQADGIEVPNGIS
jgi:hypothetical protein